MRKWLRRIRGAIGIGLTWAMTWFSAGMVWRFVVGFGPGDVPFPLVFGALGFLTGATFSGVLGVVEGRRRFDQMSVPRFAALGAIAGLLFSVPLVLTGGEFVVWLGPVVALAGAVSAAGTLALARKAEERELLDAAADLSDVGLSEDETRQLLGDGRRS